MPWVIGIDEAGYGPNLGPLVQAAVLLWTEDDDHSGWRSHRKWIRRCDEQIDDRFLIDDSKKVHQGNGKLAKLERTVLPLLNICSILPESRFVPTLAGMLALDSQCIGDHHPKLAEELWLDGEMRLPLEWEPGDCSALLANYSLMINYGFYAILPRIVGTASFNAVITRTNNKAEILSEGLIALMSKIILAGRVSGPYRAESPLHIYCDKQGGRHYYAPLLQETFPNGWVVAERESPAESRYRIEKLDREVTVIFRPRADADSISVALASMTAKYLREVCMRQFNAFWAKHVPGIQPTAGYPLDAKRFYREIEPAMKKLGIAKEAVWRMK